METLLNYDVALIIPLAVYYYFKNKRLKLKLIELEQSTSKEEQILKKVSIDTETATHSVTVDKKRPNEYLSITGYFLIHYQYANDEITERTVKVTGIDNQLHGYCEQRYSNRSFDLERILRCRI